MNKRELENYRSTARAAASRLMMWGEITPELFDEIVEDYAHRDNLDVKLLGAEVKNVLAAIGMMRAAEKQPQSKKKKAAKRKP